MLKDLTAEELNESFKQFIGDVDEDVAPPTVDNFPPDEERQQAVEMPLPPSSESFPFSAIPPSAAQIPRQVIGGGTPTVNDADDDSNASQGNSSFTPIATSVYSQRYFQLLQTSISLIHRFALRPNH